MSAMRRFLSFRDFDWALLGMVLAALHDLGLEIYSATLHTKYVGFHTKQMFWIAAGWLPCLSSPRSTITS
jgi:rod shape determining protein RodA